MFKGEFKRAKSIWFTFRNTISEIVIMAKKLLEKSTFENDAMLCRHCLECCAAMIPCYHDEIFCPSLAPAISLPEQPFKTKIPASLQWFHRHHIHGCGTFQSKMGGGTKRLLQYRPIWCPPGSIGSHIHKKWDFLSTFLFFQIFRFGLSVFWSGWFGIQI